ncbi:MAG: rRNA adenine N-6-methyltransferase family protein, partial [Planctomycetota bacterium]
MAQTLSEIKQLLAAHGLHPKHKFGQNFLHDGNHMRRIMDAAELSPGDVVLEVGPGTGALTERLLEDGAQVVAVEIDTDLEPVLTA